ncbi:MAG TPA: cyclic nucleotide-binding domain-containing protein, partial [Flavisolibacter sp.]|nr:cyclic nucleotide-binding domain-containing protein [Flavisolibacter sp.]
IMVISEYLSFLQKIPLFAGLDYAGLAELATYLERETYPAHHTIFWMDEKGDHLYIIQNGKVQISYHDESGREITLATLNPGSFFGELSLIDGGTHTATARTITETTVLILNRESFYKVLDSHPKFGHSILDELSSRLRSSTIKLRGIININEQLVAKSSHFQQSVDRLAKSLTSGIFISVIIVFIILWMSVQIFLYKKNGFNHISFIDRPPTFFLLGFIITLTSFLLTMLILNSQRRQAENDRIRGEIEYQINLKAQTEVMKLQLKMDDLIEMVNKLTKEQSIEEN